MTTRFPGQIYGFRPVTSPSVLYLQIWDNGMWHTIATVSYLANSAADSATVFGAIAQQLGKLEGARFIDGAGKVWFQG